MDSNALLVALISFGIMVGGIHLARRIGNRLLRSLAQAGAVFLAIASMSFTAMQFSSPVWVVRQAGAYLGYMLMAYLLGALLVWLVRLVRRRRAAT